MGRTPSMVMTALRTADLVKNFYEDCRERGLTAATIATTERPLRRFISDNPDLPTDPAAIEGWLRQRGDSFEKRGDIFKRIQAFYSYLARVGVLSPSPIPSGKVGHPKNSPAIKNPQGRPRTKSTVESSPKDSDKLVGAGNPILQATSIAPSLQLPAPPSFKTADLVTEYLTSCDSRGLSDKTVQYYRFFLTHFAEKFPDFPLNIEAIEAFLAETPKERDNYRFLQFSTIKAFYYWIEDRKNLPQAHLKFRMAKPKVGRKVRNSLSNAQVLQLLALDMPAEHRALINLLLEAGPRKREIMSLRVESVQESRIVVKGKTGEHNIEISRELAQELRALVPSGSGLIWRREDGRQVPGQYMYLTVRHYLEQIGVKAGKLGPHMLRHTYGRLYLEHGGDLESLRQQLGHTKITTTAIYSELASGQVRTRAMAASPLQNARRQMSEAYRRQYGDPDETAKARAKRESAKPLPGQIHMDEILSKGEQEGGQDV